MLEVIHRYHAKIKKILELEHYRRNIIKINKDSSDEEIQEIVSYLKRKKQDFSAIRFRQHMILIKKKFFWIQNVE